MNGCESYTQDLLYITIHSLLIEKLFIINEAQDIMTCCIYSQSKAWNDPIYCVTHTTHFTQMQFQYIDMSFKYLFINNEVVDLRFLDFYPWAFRCVLE